MTEGHLVWPMLALLLVFLLKLDYKTIMLNPKAIF